MELTFNDEQRALRAEVTAFLAEERAVGAFTPGVDVWLRTGKAGSRHSWWSAPAGQPQEA